MTLAIILLGWQSVKIVKEKKKKTKIRASKNSPLSEKKNINFTKIFLLLQTYFKKEKNLMLSLIQTEKRLSVLCNLRKWVNIKMFSPVI